MTQFNQFLLLLPCIVLKKNPKALEIASLAKAVPYLEFGLDADDKKCHELGEVLKKFYFGYTAISKRTIWTFLMVCDWNFILEQNEGL